MTPSAALIVIVLPEPIVVTPVPPAIVKVSESKSIVPVPLSPAKFKSSSTSNASSVVTRVENEPLAFSKPVTRVENDELGFVKEPLTPASVRPRMNVAFVPNEPLISVAIWAEPLINVFDNSVSAVVNLVEKLPLSVFNPAILAVACVILVEKLALASVNEPLMLEAICAEPDITPLNIPVNAVPVIRPVVLLKTKDESPSRLPPSLNCICVFEPPAPAFVKLIQMNQLKLLNH